MNAPIVLFAFNRLEPLKRCVTSLLENKDAAETDLFVFVDGPRANNVEDNEKVKSVHKYVKSIVGFKSIETFFSEKNKGLGASLIAGITEVINRYDWAIVVEDDLIVSRNFLAFMNHGLNKYKENPEVFSICGYSNKVSVPKGYDYDAYFCPRSSSWGWATWKDRWEKCDWELKDWASVEHNRSAFNQWGGSDCFGMLCGWHEGRNMSWAIRFCYSQFLDNAVSLFPIISKVNNDGFDGNGTNCKKWSRFKSVFDDSDVKNFRLPANTIVLGKFRREVMRYNSILLRAISKIMYLLYR